MGYRIREDRMSWVLYIVFLLGSAAGPPHTQAIGTFGDQASCESAAKSAHAQLGLSNTNSATRFMCVPTTPRTLQQ
jgi:hypothetical protein